MAKTGSAYLLYNRRMADEQGQSSRIPEPDERMLKETHDKLTEVLHLANYPYQSKQEYSVFNLNPNDAESVKNYGYYHEGKLTDDEYDEKKLFEKEYNKPMAVVFRTAEGDKQYVFLERSSEAGDVVKKLQAAQQAKSK